LKTLPPIYLAIIVSPCGAEQVADVSLERGIMQRYADAFNRMSAGDRPRHRARVVKRQLAAAEVRACH
jgi:hypothetical protein